MAYRITTPGDYRQHYRRSMEERSDFWAEIAHNFDWIKPWQQVCSGDLSHVDVRWFSGGKLNITANCLDRHLSARGNQTAVIYESNDPNTETIRYTYRELHHYVCKTAHMFQALSVQKGDRICLYMSMVPELLMAVLACARIGAIHSVVFSGLSPKALAQRIHDANCCLLITNDGGLRGNKVVPLKATADKA